MKVQEQKLFTTDYTYCSWNYKNTLYSII